MTDPERRIALAREGLDAYLAGDLNRVLERMSEDVVVVSGPGLPEEGTYRGRDQFLAWTTRWLDAWDEFGMEVKTIDPVGERHAVAEVRQRGRGRGSGIEVEMSTGHVYEFAGEELIYFALYASPEQALADARSREEGHNDGD